MGDIPEALLAAAFDLVEAMQSNDMDALTASDTRYANMLTNDVNAIARALMAAAREADEAATKRERERLSDISSALGVGMGDENTTAEQFEARIRSSAEHNYSAGMMRAALIVEELSKRPSTKWGEIITAIKSAMPAAILKGEA